jgi:predicted metal-dependent peptidase
MEEIASVDWGQIFKKRLSAYSNELSKWKPWDKRYAGNPMLRTRIPSRIPPKDTLPETNIAIDTSYSMSFSELSVILTELQAALQEAKIKKLNVILWHSAAYWTRSYTSVSKTDFVKINEDIQKNWQRGGTEVISAYDKIIEKKWKNKFTIIFTDGYVEDHAPGSKAMNKATEALDVNNLIWGIIQPSTGMQYQQWESLTGDLPGEKIGIFLDTNMFNKHR